MSEHAWWAMVGSAGLELSKGLCPERSCGKDWNGYKAAVSPTGSCQIFVVRGKE